MPSVLTRYLIVELCKYHLLCALTLSVVFSFFIFFEQLQEVGKGAYRILDALLYILLTAPDRLVQLAPFVALFGTIFMLERFSKHNEIISILATGRSFSYITRQIAFASLPLILAISAASQWIAPPLNKTAELHRIARITDTDKLTSTQSFWARHKQQILNIGTPDLNNSPKNLLMYELDQNNGLRKQIKAKSAILAADGSWRLIDVTEKYFHEGGLSLRHLDERVWMPFTNNFQTALSELPINTLSLDQLLARIQQAVKAGTFDNQASLLFWERLLLPLTIAGMACLAAVFMLAGIRQESVNWQVLTCSSIGILAFTLGKISITPDEWALHPGWVAATPVVVTWVISSMQGYRNIRSWH